MGVAASCGASLQVLLILGNLKMYVSDPSNVHSHLHTHVLPVLQTHRNCSESLEWKGYLSRAVLLFLALTLLSQTFISYPCSAPVIMCHLTLN